MSDQDVVLNDGHSEAEAGVKEEDQHEDVVEHGVAIVVGTAQVTNEGCNIPYPVDKSEMEDIIGKYATHGRGSDAPEDHAKMHHCMFVKATSEVHHC